MPGHPAAPRESYISNLRLNRELAGSRRVRPSPIFRRPSPAKLPSLAIDFDSSLHFVVHLVHLLLIT